MPWQTRLLEPERIVESTFSGLLSPAELTAGFTGSVALGKQGDTLLFLADCTALEGGHSLLDVFSLLNMFESMGLNRRVKEAVLLGESTPAADRLEFYETACRNRGYMVRLFSDRDQAIAWLRA